MEDFKPNYVRAFVGQTVKSVDLEARRVTHLITTPAVDRAGDVVDSEGVEVDNFLRNPVVPINHDYDVRSIVGRAVSMRVERKGITATTQFRETDLGTEAMRLASEGLGGWSIGFTPISRHSIKEGAQEGCKVCKQRFAAAAEGKDAGDHVPGMYASHFLKSDLLEYSLVSIPMNQEIINNAVARGLVTAEHARVFFRSLPVTSSDEAALAPNAEAGDETLTTPGLRRMLRRFDMDEARRRISETLERLE